ncbi:MAG: tetratricopeptide repeat protein [Cyanothece sp. SIO2G6]|nr:tetratricopeptide repeat protein [Cyanothece sp. SIO2G6]
MRYAAHALPLAMFMALFAPAVEVAAAQHLQVSEVFRETKAYRLTVAPDVQGPQGSGIINVVEEPQGLKSLSEAAATPQRLAQADDRKAEADRLYQLGKQQFNTSQFQAALESWQAALELYQAMGSREEEGDTLNALGLLFRVAGQVPIAIDYHEQALAIAREIGDRQGEGNALGNLGIAYFRLGQYQEAIALYEQCLEIAREIGDRRGEGTALGNLGLAYADLGQYQEAIALFEQRLVIAHEIGDRRGEGTALGNLGSAYRNLGQYQEAIALFEQQLEITREIGDRRGEGHALGNLGIAYDDLGQYQEAIAFYEQRLVIARKIGDRRGEGHALGNLGIAYTNLGQYQEAIALFEQRLVIAREIGDRRGEGHALGNLGSAYANLGQYQEAIALFEQRLVIAHEIGDRRGEGTALGNLGSAYRNLGQYQEAIALFEQVLVIAREIGDRRGEGHALGNLGSAYANLGQYQEAIALFEQVLVIRREIGDRRGEGTALGNLGSAYADLGQYQEAIALHEQALVIAREIGNRQGEGATLNNLGNAYADLGQYQEAIAFYEQRLVIAREIGDRAGESLGLNNLGAALGETAQYNQAAISLAQSIEVYESLRTALPDEQLISLIDTQQRAYVNLKRALVAQEKNDNALAISERGRAQAFALQLLRRLRQTSDDPAPDAPDLITLEKIQQIARDTDTTLVEYALIADLFLYIWVVQPSGEIEFRSVELNGEDTDTPIALSALDGPLYRSTPDPSEVDTLVTDSRSILIESTDSTATPTEKLQELHQLLIDPIADLLPTDSNAPVAFIPQGSLFHVPFAALQDDNGTYLIEKHTLLTAPSIQVLGLAHDTAQTRSGQSLTTNPVIVGNPTMPEVTVSTPAGFVTNRLTPLAGAEAEALQIASVLNTTALTDDQATEATVKAQLPNASLIHLATHGLLDYGESPLDIPGAIALAPTATEDGLLTSGEILDMELQADLAILSACDTGLGNITGDGVVGLSRSLITAGVPSVMVSLWAVNDASTSRLMQRFYEFLATDEFTKAEALRQAQLSLLYGEDVETRLESVRAGAAPRYREGFEPVGDRHPYHWAPFVLIGNGL